MKQKNEALKIRDSDGKLHVVCPYIDKIDALLHLIQLNESIISIDDLFEIRLYLESIREIAKVWQKEDDVEGHIAMTNIGNPYNFMAVIKNIKIDVHNNNCTIDRIDEHLKTYL